MKKRIIAVLVVLCAISCTMFAASKKRTSIDDFLKEYETFVVKAEKAAQTNKISDLTKLSLESAKLAEKCEALEDSDEWTIADTKKYLDLSTRCTNAISKLSSSTTSAASSALDDYDALMQAYGL